jgi:hypothetical protein
MALEKPFRILHHLITNRSNQLDPVPITQFHNPSLAGTARLDDRLKIAPRLVRKPDIRDY